MSKKKNPVWESMTRLTFGPYAVRVWVEDLNEGPNPSVLQYVQLLEQEVGCGQWPKNYVAERIASAPVGVAAVEVLDVAGNGVVFYPDWK